MGDTLKLYRADCDNGDIIIKGEDNSLVAFMCRFENNAYEGKQNKAKLNESATSYNKERYSVH
jgi:hypothetical protein